MTTLYTRTFSLKDSLSDTQVIEQWRFLMEELVPAINKFKGTRSGKVYSGAGGLRSDLTFLWEMDDAGVYERALVDQNLRKLIPKAYAGWDMKSAGQSFRREVTAELIQALSSKP